VTVDGLIIGNSSLVQFCSADYRAALKKILT